MAAVKHDHIVTIFQVDEERGVPFLAMEFLAGEPLDERLKREEKRWSRGEFVGLGRAEFRAITSTYIASSVDSLPGNSGGPVVDEAGVLIGVVAQGTASEENDFRYDVDPQKKDDWQTFLVPCDAVMRIMAHIAIKALAR